MAYIAPSYITSNAVLKTRLINFDASYEPNGYALKPEHKAELDKMLTYVRFIKSFSYWLVGYASKVGNHAKNQTLSSNRMLAVENYLGDHNPLFRDPDRLAGFVARGDTAYVAAADDNSADERAVEVHLFIGTDVPPPPPTGHIVRHKPPLPGGPRFTDWQVASPGGAFVAEIVGGGFNIFFIKNIKLNEERGYFQPVAGVGAGLSIPGLGLIGRIVQRIITGAAGSPFSYTSVTPPHPVTWKEVEDCLVRVSSAGAGVVAGRHVVGYGTAIITFSSPGIYDYGPSELPLKEAMDLWQFQSTGKQWQLGVNASVVVGPLKRIPG